MGAQNGVKWKLFDWNTSYINFNIFGDAEFESDINFYVHPIWGLKWGPKMGVKWKLFDWNTSYINFNIFGDAEFESDINFYVRPIWGPKMGVKWKLFDWNTLYINFEYLWHSKVKGPTLTILVFEKN